MNLNSQKTSHILPWQASYVISLMRFWEMGLNILCRTKPGSLTTNSDQMRLWYSESSLYKFISRYLPCKMLQLFYPSHYPIVDSPCSDSHNRWDFLWIVSALLPCIIQSCGRAVSLIRKARLAKTFRKTNILHGFVTFWYKVWLEGSSKHSG